MIKKLVTEVFDCDFKEALETKRPKSWLKSVSAFANSIGGMLFFSVDDDKQIVGLDAAKDDGESISRLISARQRSSQVMMII